MKRAGYISIKNDICRNCLGHGYIKGIHCLASTPDKCDVSNGSGMVVVKRTIEITVTPKKVSHDDALDK